MIYAANWKLFKTPEESQTYWSHFVSKCPPSAVDRVVFFPPASSWFVASKNSITWGAQNVWAQSEGAYTGENSAQTLKTMGGQFVLVGHSERRALFQETDELLSQKIALLESLDLQPVLCVGESLEERQQGCLESVLKTQVNKSLAAADRSRQQYIAYEPVWAIGTGLTAKTEDVVQAHTFISSVAAQMGFEKVSIWYGGSVKATNVASLCISEVEGVLVGSASLKSDDFVDLIKAAERV